LTERTPDDGPWHDAADLAALDPDFPTGVQVAGQPVGLYLVGGTVHALENICPHAHALLTEGFQQDGLIECPLHAARFEIATGLCLDDIGQRNLVCHRTRLVDGRVQVRLSAEDQA
jgi:nitrite reductase/ring-hydroxylating ferredoxin subunit